MREYLQGQRPHMQGAIQRILARFSRRQLAVLTGVLLVADLLVPDPIPFVDEIALGLLTLVLSRRSGRPASGGERRPVNGNTKSGV